MTTPATQASLPVVFVNGELMPGGASAISPRDRGFTLADGLFETMRVRGGVVFRLDHHLARLSDGLRRMAIAEPSNLRSWIAEAIAHAEMAQASVRLTVTRGPGPGGLAPPAEARPTTVITIAPMPSVHMDTYRKGLRAVISSGRRNPRAMSAGLKTLSYTDAVLAWIEAQRAGADEALLLDTDGHCSEATASNLFVLHNGVLRTPPTTCAALPGITRATILEIAASLNIPAREDVIDADELQRADEVFLTSSLRGVAPLQAIDGRPIGTGTPGAVTMQIAGAYDALVNQECGTA
jgi:branched-chain amino acid aminotransferase